MSETQPSLLAVTSTPIARRSWRRKETWIASGLLSGIAARCGSCQPAVDRFVTEAPVPADLLFGQPILLGQFVERGLNDREHAESSSIVSAPSEGPARCLVLALRMALSNSRSRSMSTGAQQGLAVWGPGMVLCNGHSSIAMAQAACLRNGGGAASLGRLDLTFNRRVPSQRQVRSRVQVVLEVRSHYATHMLFVDNDHMVEARPPDGSEQPFYARVSVRREASSSSRNASKRASLVTLAPWNPSLRLLSNCTRSACFRLSTSGCSYQTGRKPLNYRENIHW